jgi:hypothetical protein
VHAVRGIRLECCVPGFAVARGRVLANAIRHIARRSRILDGNDDEGKMLGGIGRID